MFSTFLKTFRQISDPKILKALGWATLLTLLAVVLAVALGVSLMDSILDFSRVLYNLGSAREKIGFGDLLNFWVVH